MSIIKHTLDRRVSIAPMMGWTDRHDRYFLRLISPNALLYTVMISTGALIFGKKLEILDYSPEEHPIALQLGGSEPKDLAICAQLAEQRGYDEVNLNCGCPSNRVQNGSFGACLMADPKRVANCIDAMKQVVSIPVTVKTRIGIDDMDSYEFLTDFISHVSEKGCDIFIIHARKAMLKGLSPAENRTIPPLKWDVAYMLKRDFPHLSIILNGGIRRIEDIRNSLNHVDGVMIGREAYKNPYFLADIEREIFQTASVRSRHDVINDLLPYINETLQKGVPLKDITQHISGLYKGIPGARRWRQILSQEACNPAANANILTDALKQIFF
ncbi:MAG: tRNA dihydrouridine(20/20a) synthase DusA [Alphaproteobacteria bacterium]|nr:tRNA dihydrouridine(20/20a) synthase DusA [Alphaproteobacteria bacterium]